MTKRILAMLAMLLLVFSLFACSNKNTDNTTDNTASTTEETGEFVEEEGVFGEQPEVTIYANGGIIWFGSEEVYDVDLSAATMDKGLLVSEAIGEKIQSVEKENAEFAGWTVYAVTTGEWLESEKVELAEGQLCVACGDYGYYFMSEYEVVSESATTDELLNMECDGRNIYALANWK